MIFFEVKEGELAVAVGMDGRIADLGSQGKVGNPVQMRVVRKGYPIPSLTHSSPHT